MFIALMFFYCSVIAVIVLCVVPALKCDVVIVITPFAVVSFLFYAGVALVHSLDVVFL